MYKKSAQELCAEVLQEVLSTTGITATAGIAPNLYLCKIAMDIVAKHIPANSDGAKIATLDEISYRKTLWGHKPLTDFWQIGTGTCRRLEKNALFTMGDIARMSLKNPNYLYKLFGINAEILIDHAWGYEPCTIKHIKTYKPIKNSLGSGQVLQRPYPINQARIIVQEMAEQLSFELVEKQLATNSFTLVVCYDGISLEKVDEFPHNNSAIVDKITKFITLNIANKILIEDIANHLALSISRISHIFKEETGISILKYINKRRMYLAKEFIRSGDTFIEVASKCGFQDYTSFFRTFKKEYGITPGEYAKAINIFED